MMRGYISAGSMIALDPFDSEYLNLNAGMIDSAGRAPPVKGSAPSNSPPIRRQKGSLASSIPSLARGDRGREVGASTMPSRCHLDASVPGKPGLTPLLLFLPRSSIGEESSAPETHDDACCTTLQVSLKSTIIANAKKLPLSTRSWLEASYG